MRILFFFLGGGGSFIGIVFLGRGGEVYRIFFFFKRKIKLIMHTSARPANCAQWQAAHYFFSFFFTFNKKIH